MIIEITILLFLLIIVREMLIFIKMVVSFGHYFLSLIDYNLMLTIFNKVSLHWLQCLLRHLNSISDLFLSEILDRALGCPYKFDRLIFSLQGISAKEIRCMMHSRYIVNCVRSITHTQLRSHFDC